MEEVAIVGLDLAKNVFQVHGVSSTGAVAFRKQLRRASETPSLQQTSSTDVPFSACRRAKAICSSAYRFRFMAPSIVDQDARKSLVQDGPGLRVRTTAATELDRSEPGFPRFAFSKLKALLRRAAARSIDELWDVISRSLNAFTPAECTNYFAAAGYDAW